MFGPVDIKKLNLVEVENFKNPAHRWHSLPETHGGALVGGDPDTIIERSDAASPIFSISDALAPILILHGDQDPLVPLSISEEFYERIVKAGYEDRADLVVVKNGGHGTRELFQPMTKQLILDFFDSHLRGGERK
jgi:dipeptidyl aminopeptidase/acylaminoacyl peptidase